MAGSSIQRIFWRIRGSEMPKAVKWSFGVLGCAALFWVANTVSAAARAGYATAGMPGMTDALEEAFMPPKATLSLDVIDLAAGAAAVVLVLLVILYQAAEGAQRRGEEHGSARWGTPSDIAPFMDRDKRKNLLLTSTERISFARRPKPEHQRNLNVMCVGASGSGKSRMFIMPNLVQAQCSGLVVDPKAELLAMAGDSLIKAGFKIRVFNLVDLAASDGFNPFVYIRAGHEPEDVMLMVRNIIANTDGGPAAGGDKFWERAETALLTALVAFVASTHDEADRTLGSVVDLLGSMKVNEDGDLSVADRLFAGAKDHLEENPWLPRAELLDFAIRQYGIYLQAAGKTASSIIVTLATRLSPLLIPAVRRLVSRDTVNLDMLGFERTMLFLVISDTNNQFAWLSALLFSVFFQRSIYLADRQLDRGLPVPVVCWMDEFANVGRIPDFEIMIATFRSRRISAVVVVQNLGQGKARYKEGWDAIIGNCDSLLYLGTADRVTNEEISKRLGAQTITVKDSSRSRGLKGSSSVSSRRQSRQLLNADEIGRLPGNEALVLVRGLPPFRSRKLSPVPAGTLYTHRPEGVMQ